MDDELLDIELTPTRQSQISIGHLWHGLKLTQILRWSGSIILAAAALAFMYQGIYSFSPMTRHWIILAVCLLLGLFGMVTGNLLKEEKGARLFLGLAAASFPVLASQLGAMFFSMFGTPPAGMPQPLVFTLTNSSMLLLITGLTLAIIVPLSHLAFRILARPQAGTLTIMYTLANLCMLIPLRIDFWICAIIMIVAGALFWIDSRALSKDFRLDSFEGRASRLMLSGPLAVMIGRSFFYPMEPAYYGFMLIVSGACFTFYWGRLARNNWARRTSRTAGLTAIATGWWICYIQMLDSFDIGTAAAIYLGLLPLAAALAGHSFISTGKTARYQRMSAAMTALASVIFVHCIQATISASVTAIVTAAVILVLGTLVAEKSVLVVGGLASVIGLGNLCILAFRMHIGHAWLILAVIGISILLGASLIETKRPWKVLKHSSMWGILKQSKS
jgi:hypothetical protein